jgi:Ras-related protein Rab-28
VRVGGFFVSARSGENVVKTLYKTAGEVAGCPLSDYELAFFDKVLTVTAAPKASEEEEGRTPYADQIEAEDLALEAAKKKKKGCCVA